jgi:curved DNA-binding protein CbpA
MEPGITWYDILNVPPDASSEEIGQAYRSKAGLLRPERISGAPLKVATAAAQAGNPRRGAARAGRSGGSIRP